MKWEGRGNKRLRTKSNVERQQEVENSNTKNSKDSLAHIQNRREEKKEEELLPFVSDSPAPYKNGPNKSI